MVAVVAVAMGLVAAPALAQTTETVSFTSPGETAVVVPPGVTSLDVVAVGGSGGAGDAGEGTTAGGQGAQVTGTIAVTPGQTLYLEVGGDGTSGVSGSYGEYAGGGGGASDVRTAPASGPQTDGTGTGGTTTGQSGQTPAVRMLGASRVGITGKRLPARVGVPLKLSCAGAPCSGRVTLTVAKTVSGPKGKADGHRGKRTHRRETLT